MNINIFKVAGILTLVFQTILCLNVEGTGYNFITVDSVSRGFYLYVPSVYRISDERILLPGLFVLHGRGGSGSLTSTYMGFKELSESTEEFIAIFPEGECETENTNCEWNIGPSSNGDLDDVKLLDTLARYLYNNDIIESLRLDINQVFFTGHSQGAYMNYIYARENDISVKSIAPYAGHDGGFWGQGETPSNNISVLHMHGLVDSVVPIEDPTYYGSYIYDIEYWLGHNKCSDVSIDSYVEDEDLEGDVILRKYSSCPIGGKVYGLLFPTQDHQWVDIPNGKIQDGFTTGLDSFASLIWNLTKQMTGDNVEAPYPNDDIVMDVGGRCSVVLGFLIWLCIYVSSWKMYF